MDGHRANIWCSHNWIGDWQKRERLLFYQQESVQLRAASVNTARLVCPSDFPSFLSAVASLLSLKCVWTRWFVYNCSQPPVPANKATPRNWWSRVTMDDCGCEYLLTSSLFLSHAPTPKMPPTSSASAVNRDKYFGPGAWLMAPLIALACFYWHVWLWKSPHD